MAVEGLSSNPWFILRTPLQFSLLKNSWLVEDAISLFIVCSLNWFVLTQL